MKKVIYTVFMILLSTAFFTVSQAESIQNAAREYSGIVKDAKTGKAITQCKVFIKDTEVGTVTNNDGEFSIKYRDKNRGRNLVFVAIGYARHEEKVSDLKLENNVIRLIPLSIIMDEVVVRDPADILVKALSKIDQNYPSLYENFEAFYRETVKKNRKFIDIAQGSLNIRKSPYLGNRSDKARIVKGYRSQDYEAKDTLVFKLKGGVNSMLYLDIVKFPGNVLRRDVLQFYNYKLGNVRIVDQKLNYEILFSPKPNLKIPLYTGTIYVDEETLGISKISFGYVGEDLKKASDQFVHKKPDLAVVTPLKVWYNIEYRQSGDKWYQYYTKSNLIMKINWKKRLFNSTFYSNSEMVVTNREPGQPDPPIENKQVVRDHHVFAEKAVSVSDSDFWKEHNIIRPEEDLKKAMIKIEKKQKHKRN